MSAVRLARSRGHRPEPFGCGLAARSATLTWSRGHGELARLDTRELKQLLHHLHDAVHLAVGAAQEVLRRLRIVRSRRSAASRHGLDRGERRAQLVRDVGDEVAPHLLDAR